MTSYNCPKCNSENTSSFEMIYKSGTNTGRLQSFSVGLDGNVTGTGGNFNTQSVLAAQVAPPPMPDTIFSSLAAMFVMLAVFGVSFFALNFFFDSITMLMIVPATIAGTIGIILHLTVSKPLEEQKRQWRTAMFKWQKSFLCLKCGNSWRLKKT